MFTRTNVGIGNRALFTKSQFTVYVENDPQCDPTRALDIAFWREFFSHFFPDLNITFSPLGGKEQVMLMARKILDSSIPNCLCALDSDYERHFETLQDDERIFYTFGYGVENDIINDAAVAGIIRSILPGLDDIGAHGAQLWNIIEETIKLERIALVADQIAKARGTSILDRKHPQSDLMHDGKIPVRFRRKKILAETRRAKQERRAAQFVFAPYASTHLVPAHHYMEIVYHTFSRYISMFTNVKFSHENFIAICVGCIQNFLFYFLPDTLRQYYNKLGRRDIEKYSSI